VLVVDDDVRNAFSLTALLERDRATVVIAESGPAAIAMLAQTPDIDIVLMDIMMPIMDGYETIRAIRSFDGYKRLPIIAVTAKVVSGERQRCIDAGANDFVPKPINTAELLAALGPWLVSPAGGDRVTVPTDDVEATSSSVRILLVDDNAGKRFALRAVLAPLGFRIVEADSGFAALRSILTEDFAVILLDVCMPVMDGFETASLIRQRSRNEMTPIIFITAYTEDEIPATDRYTGGAVDFIFAPVPPDELRSKVSAFAHLYERAQELARAAREVQITADQLRLLTDAAPIGIFRTDSEGRYVHTNPRWTEITGLTPEEAAGQPWRTILAAEDRTALGDESAPAGAPQGELCHRFELCAPGEASRIVLVTARAIPDGAGGSAGWVGTLADVSVEVRAEAAMSEARDAALNSSAMQRNFTASASHELRTPTTSILGFVEEVLEDGALSEENRGHLLIVLATPSASATSSTTCSSSASRRSGRP
jgi:PAS domain S-box-containing protein